ncbi:hypothetical protein DH2020_006117 [Rehmannia glutinosa]|uniref:PPIase cyclophilin-type domain-containing protein n=1 Tax=Rehmannia glutinosa TaxID=99300 RepID=A0ABR0XII8_REHGL
MEKINRKRPLVFLDVSIDGDPAERMIFELFTDFAPKTAENFRALCTGEKGVSTKTGKPLHYRGTFFHLIIKGHVAQGTFCGKMVNLEKVYMMESFQLPSYSKLEPKAISFELFCYVDGTVILERAVLWLAGQKYVFMFVDESPKLKHDGPGLLTMAIDDRDERGSLFYVTFKADHHLDRKSVVFGKLVNGLEVLKKIENAGDEEGRPTVTVKIINSGELLDDKKKGNRLKMGKDSIEENNNEVRRKGKHKKSSKKKRKRRRYYTSESDSSTDTDTESSESDSDSDSYATSLSDTSSSSDDRRKKRKRSKRDRNRRGKRKDRRREKRRKRRDRKTKRKSKRNNASDSESVSKNNAVAGALDGKRKSSGNQSPLVQERETSTVNHRKGEATDMSEREEGEFPRENGDHQSNGIGLEMESDQSADRHPDLVDDHPSKSRFVLLSFKFLFFYVYPQDFVIYQNSDGRSRNLSPRRTMSRSMSISPRRSAHRSPGLGVTHSRSRSRSVSRSPQRISDKSRSNSPVRSGSSRSPIRSPPRSKTGRSSSMSPPVRSPQQSRSRSATISPPRRRVTQSPARTSSRRSLRSASRSPVRSSRRSLSRSSGKPSRRSLSRSPKRSLHRSVSRSSGRAPPRRSPSLSPVRAPGRIVRRSYSRSPVGAGRRARSPISDRGRSSSRSASLDGSPKRIRRGRGFSDRYSYVRRYRSRSPDRSPIRPYRYGGRNDRDRYSSYRRSPRRYRSPPRGRTPPRYRGGRRSRTRSPSVSRSPIRYRNRRYSHSRSPVRSNSPVGRYRGSVRGERRKSPSSSRSRSRSESRSSRNSQSPPRRADKGNSRSSSGSSPRKTGLVSYGDGSPDSVRD